MKYALLLLLVPAVVAFAPRGPARFPPGPPGGFGFPPPPPRELPPGFEVVLPAEIVTQLKAIHEDDNMSPLDKHEKIDQILVNLPEDIAEKLPKPPGYDSLPQDVKDKLKEIHRDKSLGWRQRVDKLREYINSLPEQSRRLLPPMGPPPPQASGFGPRPF